MPSTNLEIQFNQVVGKLSSQSQNKYLELKHV
jgi:hypothetical protein